MKNYALTLMTIFCTAAMGVTIKRNITLNDFSAGRLSPLMNSRVELPQYRKGAKTLQNMMVRSQGPIQRRPGTKYIAAVKNADDETRIIPFSDSDDFIVELGDYYARFFTDGAPVADANGADHYEVDTPWAESDVFELQYAMAEGSMRIVHGDYEPYKLERPDDTVASTWTCEAIGSTTGPFLDENTDHTWTLSVNATTGTGKTVISTDDLFVSTHVGALFQISHIIEGAGVTYEFAVNNYPSGTEESSEITIRKYQYYTVISDTDWRGTLEIQRSYDGLNWLTVHQHSNMYLNALQYAGREMEATCQYRLQMIGLYRTDHNKRHNEKTCNASISTEPMTTNGVVEITLVGGLKTATCDIKIDIGIANTATWRWAEGAWSDYQGWPRTVEYHEQRIIYGGTKSSPETVWASIIAEEDGDYDDFTANIDSDIEGNLGGPDDIAWTYKFPGMGDAQWIKSGKYLFVGTKKGVMMLGQPGRPITPNFPPIARMQNYNACAFLQPASAASAILYVEKGRQKIRELGYINTRDTYIAPDMTVLSEDITGEGIVDLAFQNRPDPVLWCVRSDGTLISFTYQRNDGIAAWSLHISSDDDFESVAQIPGTNADELWTVVERTPGTYIEQFQFNNWNPTDQNDYWFVDSGATDCNSLSWLAGETVAVLADSKPIGTYTVSGSGTISASGYVNYVIGLPFTSAYESMPLILYNNAGPVMGEYVDVMDVKVKFYQTMGCHIGADSSNLVDIKFSPDSFVTTLERVTDYIEAPFVWGEDREATIYMSETDPIPMTIESIHAKCIMEYDY